MPIPLKDLGKIELACSTEFHPAIVNPYLRITETVTGRGKSRKLTRKGTLVATDSYVMVEQPVDLADDETEGVVPLAAIKFARSLGKSGAAIRLVGDRALVTANGQEQASFPRGENANPLPNVDMLKKHADGEPVFSIGLNPRLLLNAAQALGAGTDQGVRVDLRDPLKPAVVSLLGQPERVALVMPVRIAASKAVA